MRTSTLVLARKSCVVALVALVAAVPLGWSCSPARGEVILPGWDVLKTVPGGTVFMGQNWEGVPVAPGSYDTVMNRLESIDLVPSSSTTIGLQIVMLQLKSVNLFDPDGPGPAPTSYYFVTLTPDQQPLGSMTVNVDAGTGPGNWSGTIDSTFPVNFDVHIGALGGPVVLPAQTCILSSSGIPWYWNDPSTGWANGVTFFENGTWITTLDTSHEAIVIPIPEPSTLTILCAGAVVPLALMRRRPRACRGPLAT
jgi:hypothetical protein